MNVCQYYSRFFQIPFELENLSNLLAQTEFEKFIHFKCDCV